MIIWRGLGFVVPIIAIGTMIVCQLAANAVLGENYFTTHGWPRLAACFLAALVIWFCGRWLNGPIAGASLDAEVAGISSPRTRHTFFFIPVQYWSIAMIAFGLYIELL